jgi:hypothetical protein
MGYLVMWPALQRRLDLLETAVDAELHGLLKDTKDP